MNNDSEGRAAVRVLQTRPQCDSCCHRHQGGHHSGLVCQSLQSSEVHRGQGHCWLSLQRRLLDPWRIKGKFEEDNPRQVA